jgi:pilus assembly protein CpaB
MRTGANLIILLVAIAMGGVAAFLARGWLTSHSANSIAVEKPGTIVVAAAPLAFGVAITTDNVAEIPWPSKTLPDGAFAHVQELVKDGRRVVLTPFVRNEPIVASRVTAPNQRASLSTMIADGKRAVTVSVDDVRGVAGFIFPGDYVDVVLTRTNNNEGPHDFAEVVLQHVKVLAIDQVAGERQDHPTVAKAVTVELSPEQALKITLAANTGRLSLILRQSAEEGMAADLRVTDRDLYASEIAAAPDPPPPSAAAPPPPPAPVLAPEPPTTRTVTVVRALKGEDYVVQRQRQ